MKKIKFDFRILMTTVGAILLVTGLTRLFTINPDAVTVSGALFTYLSIVSGGIICMVYSGLREYLQLKRRQAKRKEKRELVKGATPPKIMITCLILVFFVLIGFMHLDKIYSGIIILGLAVSAMIMVCGIIAAIILFLKKESK
jgi:putative copper export protein